MDIELLKQELLRRLTPPSVRTPIGTIPSAVMAPLHYGALGPMAPEVNTATNTPQGLDTMRAILAIAMAGQAGQQGLQQLQSGMLQNRYNAGVEGAYNRLPEGLFNPAQSGAIKSRLGDYVAERMPELNPSIVPMFSGAGVPAKIGQPFNIRSIQLLSNLPQETMTPNQVLGFLSGKVKKSEMEGLGLKEFLQGKEKVSKQDLLNHIEQSTPQIEEVVKGSKVNFKTSEEYQKLIKEAERRRDFNEADRLNREWESAEGYAPSIEEQSETKFQKYQLPGATNYREVVVKAGEKSNGKRINVLEKEAEQILRTPYDSVERAKADERLSQIRTEQRSLTGKGSEFKSSHWDEPNPLFHRRVNERTSYKSPQKNDVLFSEEFQSDWAKRGRTEGFLQPQNQLHELPIGYKVKIENVESGFGQPKEKYTVINPEGNPITASGYNRQGTINEALNELNKKADTGVPSHPLLKNWLELNLKGFIKDAIATGKRYISWTTGEQQAERYDLSKELSELNYIKNSDGTYSLTALRTGGRGAVDLGENISEDKLASTIGKEIAEKIIAGKGEPSQVYEFKKGGKVLSTPDFKIGGEWAKNLYDKQIPNILRDLTGGNITEILMPTGTKDNNGSPVYLKQPALELTPEIKDEIKKKGFDLFSALPKYESESFINIKKQKEPKKIHYALA